MWVLGSSLMLWDDLKFVPREAILTAVCEKKHTCTGKIVKKLTKYLSFDIMRSTALGPAPEAARQQPGSCVTRLNGRKGVCYNSRSISRQRLEERPGTR